MTIETINLFDFCQEPEEDDRFPQETHLTPRCWAMYRLIKHNSIVEHRKTSQREIFDKIQGYEWNEDEKAHDHCPVIWSDVAKNNQSFEHQHIIISKNFEYWIGSERETRAFLQKLWRDLSPRLKRYWDYVKLIGYDGQGRFYDKNLNPISKNDYMNDDEISSKMFYDCFNDYDIEMQKAIEKEEEKDAK